ncbi:hypothetical protein SAMN05518849_11414 [Sphingobium sp. AP50]|uniref:hypothetical protein n=1 Tax=Sphingobium sp. AP50 TaxID=1884369 RepID=UPI0008C651D5|nr:hypothetical protein [Sphingobium sp. AP50]SEJ80342.1 hypothetical protein SAMN05518849_11414 [Sphingobium sp. AP50]
MIAAAFACLFLGDSIDVGAAAYVRARHGLSCDVVARVGASARTATSWSFPLRHYDTAIISLGSNDPDNPRLAEQITRIRASLSVGRVIWLLPYHRRAAAVVAQVALRFRDDRLDLASVPTADGLHPDYSRLADALVD